MRHLSFVLKSGLLLSALLTLNSCSHGSKEAANVSDQKAQSQVESRPLSSIDPSVRAIVLADETKVSARGKRFMVSTQGQASTRAAFSVLKSGGNLIDAAVAASLTISVERPHSTGLGGGGFLIYHEAKSGRNYVFDFRERAPSSATRTMYLDKDGKVIAGKSVTGGAAVGVPGLVRGLKAVHSRFGKMKWPELFAPAIQLAEDGFDIYPSLENAIESEKSVLEKDPGSKVLFLSDSKRIVQKDLARTLRVLAKDPEDMYRGEIARKIVASVNKTGGQMTLRDLARYPVKERKPIIAEWMGYKVVSMPPPSSGGVHVVQILKLLEREKFGKTDFLTPRAMHFTAQAMQQAFADRAVFLGDPDFVQVPTAGLLSSDYLKVHYSKFTENRARKKDEVSAGKPKFNANEHTETTHLSLMDAEGNVVVSTQTINGFFGAAVVVEGTGVLLNNEMDDFSAKPGVANIFGAVGGEANAVAPGKTPLSSMSPTIVFKDGVPVLALGAPGGTRILTAVAQTIMNYFVYGMSLYEAVASPRIHHQWTPDLLSVENLPVAESSLKALHQMGYSIKRTGGLANVMAVAREGNTLVGVADPRDIGTSAGE